MTKICSKCKTDKPRTEFPWNNKKLNLIMSACKVCYRESQRDFRKNNPELQRQRDRNAYQKSKKHRVEYARKYRKDNPDKTRDTNLKSKYGISSKDYELMLEAQGGKCKICNEHQDNLKRILCVDHQHKTGKIRGLLCDTCNKFLGFYEKLSKSCEIYLS
jgi:hypothetical protein